MTICCPKSSQYTDSIGLVCYPSECITHRGMSLAGCSALRQDRRQKAPDGKMLIKHSTKVSKRGRSNRPVSRHNPDRLLLAKEDKGSIHPAKCRHIFSLVKLHLAPASMKQVWKTAQSAGMKEEGLIQPSSVPATSVHATRGKN